MIICDHANIKGPLVEMYKTVKVIWLILAVLETYISNLYVVSDFKRVPLSEFQSSKLYI